MELFVLVNHRYRILAITNRGHCQLQDDLSSDDPSTNAHRQRMIGMLQRLSQDGFHNAVQIWSKPLVTEEGIYELKVAKLRLFYFKGSNSDLMVCTSLGRKTSAKASQSAIDEAIRHKRIYDEALRNDALQYIHDSGEED